MFTGVIDSTELRSRGGSSSQAGCGSSSRSRSYIQAQQAMNVIVLFILNTIDIGPITNILYLQWSWFPEQAQQQPFVFPQFQSPMPQ
jgi:hypothetical protein